MDQSLSFQPLLFGGDINVYSVARAFHEAYGVKTIVYGMFPASVCAGSRIIDYRVREHNMTAQALGPSGHRTSVTLDPYFSLPHWLRPREERCEPWSCR